MRLRCSSGALTVTRPSAHSAHRRAVWTLTAAPISAGGVSGRVQTRARSTVTSPSWLTSSPASSARMTSTHSRSRASRTSLRGQRPPVMCSLLNSPEPSAAQNRPGYMAPSVPIACATTAGWYRWPGALTTPNGSPVACSAAPSHDQANADWPWRVLHGEKWSEHMARVKPACSAEIIASSRADGWICSWEAWIPYSVMPRPLPDGADGYAKEHEMEAAGRGGGGGGARGAARACAAPPLAAPEGPFVRRRRRAVGAGRVRAGDRPAAPHRAAAGDGALLQGRRHPPRPGRRAGVRGAAARPGRRPPPPLLDGGPGPAAAAPSGPAPHLRRRLRVARGVPDGGPGRRPPLPVGRARARRPRAGPHPRRDRR